MLGQCCYTTSWWFYKAVLGVTLQKALQMQHSGGCDMSIEARVNLGCLSGRGLLPSYLGWAGEGGRRKVAPVYLERMGAHQS